LLIARGNGNTLKFKKTTDKFHGGMEMPCAVVNGARGNVLFGVTNVGRI
jgi:predicted HTH transcriptional regulator